jgi:hypothetical protein
VSVAECLAPSRSISVEQLAKEENEMLLASSSARSARLRLVRGEDENHNQT